MPDVTIVVFDVGNVLIRWDPRYLYRRLIADADRMEHFLATVCTPAWNLEQDRGRSFTEAVAERIALFPAEEALIRAYDTGWDEMVPGPVDGAPELLADLQAAGVPLYAITNFSAEKWVRARARFPFLSAFLDTVVSAEEGLVKPDPAIYRRLLDRNGLSAASTVFIDDSLANVEGARAVGMQALHFTGIGRLRTDLAALGLPGA